MATTAETLTFQPNGHAVPRVPAGWRLFKGIEMAGLYAIDPWQAPHTIWFARPDGERAFDTSDISPDNFARLIAVGFRTPKGDSRWPWTTETLAAAYDALPAYRKAMCLPPDVREHERIESIRRALGTTLPLFSRAESMIEERRLHDNDPFWLRLSAVIGQLGDHLCDAAHICDGRTRGGHVATHHGR